MRKSTSKTKSRLLCAGLSAGAVTAGLLVAPTAALAANDITSISPSGGPTGVAVTVTATAPSGTFTTTPSFILTTATTCPANYSTSVTAPALTVAATNAVKISDTSATFVVPASITANTWNVCAYPGTTNTSALLNASATPTAAQKYVAVPSATVSPTSGASGGGNSINVTLPSTVPWTTFTNWNAIFSAGTGSCPGSYPTTPSSTVTGTVTAPTGTGTIGTVTVPVGVSGSLSSATPYTVCLFGSNGAPTSGAIGTGTALAAANSTAYNVTLPSVSLSSTIGGTGANLVVSSTNNFLTGAATPEVYVTTGTCPAVYPASGVATSGTHGPVLKSADNRGAFTLPSTATGVGTTWNACIYAGSTAGSSRLLANPTYTLATPPTLTAVVPAAGSSLGGDTITITGANLPISSGSITASLGGLPLTNVTPIDASTFTATTPPHAAQAGVPVTVTTATGTVTLPNAFDYANGISISPNTAPNTATGVWVDVKGVGFSSLTFDTAAVTVPTTASATGALASARVYLVDNKGACTGATTACVGTSAYIPGDASTVAECQTPARISDTELFCKLNLAGGALTLASGLATVATNPTVPNGTYTLTVVSNGNPAASTTGVTQSVISSGSTFTVAPF